jgi:hypothetical protein
MGTALTEIISLLKAMFVGYVRRLCRNSHKVRQPDSQVVEAFSLAQRVFSLRWPLSLWLELLCALTSCSYFTKSDTWDC